MSAELVLPALLGLSSQSRRLESASAYHQAAPTLDEACLLGAPSPAHPTPALRRHGAYERWLLSRDTQRVVVVGSLSSGLREFGSWMCTPLSEERVGDPRIISLVRRWLKAGILEKGEVTANEKGAPQGASVSVLLSNLYLHEVLDLWFERQVKPRLRGEAYLVRYIDDFVICFQFREDAERVQTVLSKRLNKFALALEPSKTKLVKFGRFAQREARVQGKRTETFSFWFYPLRHVQSQRQLQGWPKDGEVSTSPHYGQSPGAHARYAALVAQGPGLPAQPIPSWPLRLLWARRQLAIPPQGISLRERYWHKMLCSRSWAATLTWEVFHRLRDLFPLQRPTIYLTYGQMQACAVL